MPTDAELTKLRRWALELLTPNAPIDTVADLQQICRASDALISYLLTGSHPDTASPENGKDGNGKDGNGNPPEPNARPN